MEATALVTGGSSGIGLELVSRLCERGMRVLTTGSRADAPRELATAATYRRFDLAERAERDALIDWVRGEAPRLDLLVNNAGVQQLCEVGPKLESGDIEREIAIDLVAPMHLCAGLMGEVEAASGCIVNLSSGLAIAPKASAPIYCAAKAGLSSFSRTLRYQTAGRRVRVVDVVTPLVRTPMTEGRHDGAIEPGAFCAALLAKLDAGQDEIYIGKARLLPPLMRLAPGLARRIMRDA